MLAAVASFAVMVGVMNLAGYVAVGHGHEHGDVFTIISVHIVGMYGLVLVVGDLIDRIGRARSMAIGLMLMAVSNAGARLARRDPRHVAVALRARPRLEPRLRRGDDAARHARRARPSAAGWSASPTCISSFTGAALALGGGVVYTRGRIGAARRARGRARGRCPRSGSCCYHRPSAGGSSAVSPYEDLSMKTYSAKTGEITRDWYVVDAEGQTLGRLATQIADRLRGKGKPQYTPHVDTGDFVVVVNAEKIAVTGNEARREDVLPPLRLSRAGSRQRPLREQLERRPTEVLRKAVKGMLPQNQLARQQITKLKIYAGPEHPHEAQEPKPF